MKRFTLTVEVFKEEMPCKLDDGTFTTVELSPGRWCVREVSREQVTGDIGSDLDKLLSDVLRRAALLRLVDEERKDKP